MKKALIITGTILSTLAISNGVAADTYSVISGDSLWKISRQYNTKVQTLKDLNKLKSDLIHPGLKLTVNNNTSQIYIVKKGDTLGKIAKIHNTSIQTLLQQNPNIKNEHQLQIGQTINLSNNSIEPSKKTPSKPKSIASTTEFYTVNKGDTLGKIAELHNITLKNLLNINPNINTSQKIVIGQKVRVKGNPTPETNKSTIASSNKSEQPAPQQKLEQPSLEKKSAPENTSENEVKQNKQVHTKVDTTQNTITQKQPVIQQPEVTEVKHEKEIVNVKKEVTPEPIKKETPKQEVSTPSTNSSIGDTVIAAGSKYLGASYEFGASPSRTDTFDCSSFTMKAFSAAGISLPRTSRAQANVGTPVSQSAMQKGDLIFFDTDGDGVINHVGIYSGNNQMINAETGKGVAYSSLNSYWQPRIVKVMRVK
ncbi:C40 family peptidase [Bacillus toyonensis]|uniref:C40 family peptidase n=1 Tax=Bacillus toyonensis TaxID=155322 RepID=UPI002E203F31|nr:LysM peptidoglycan-binding domain-containing protein [Bacillus toyonensis]